jgi:hypothetical protein
MATARIDQLTDASTVALADELPIIQGGVTKRATVGEVRAALSIGANDYGTVANEAAMVALSAATPGSTCYRSDTTSIWMLKVSPYNSAGNWHNVGGNAASQVQVGLSPASTSLAPCVDTVNVALAELSGLSVTTKTVSTSPYTVLVTDFGKVLDCVSGSATTITIPTDATGGFTVTAGVNNVFALRQLGAGAITLPATGGGVTVNNPQGLSLVQNGPEILFTEVAANTWNLS